VNVFGNTVATHIDMNIIMSMGAWTLALAQIPFIINLFISWKTGKKVESDNPWNATTLEWATPTPPGHGNFTFDPAVYRGPYEYSRPDHEEDFIPQWEEPKKPNTKH
jgi:cytochrome c oxidase subunit 1